MDKIRIVARPINDEFVIDEVDHYIILGPLTQGGQQFSHDYIYNLMSDLVKHKLKKFYIVLGRDDIEFRQFATTDMNNIHTVYDVLDLLPNITLIKKPTRIDGLYFVPFTFQNLYTKDNDIIIGAYNTYVPYDKMQLYGINNASYDYGLVVRNNNRKQKSKRKYVYGINSHYGINDSIDINGSVINNIAHCYKIYNTVILSDVGLYLDSHFVPFDKNKTNNPSNNLSNDLSKWIDFVNKKFFKSYIVDVVLKDNDFDLQATETNGSIRIDNFIVNCPARVFDVFVELMMNVFGYRIKVNKIIIYSNKFDISKSKQYTLFINKSRPDDIILKTDTIKQLYDEQSKPAGLVLLYRYAKDLVNYTKQHKALEQTEMN